MGSSEAWHEDRDVIGLAVADRHRALLSLQEELEAVDWYDQRIAATTDADLAAILVHNRDEEKEHASMVLEWIRRRDPAFDDRLRTYLLTSLPITEVETEAESGGSDATGGPADEGSLRIGSLRGVTS
jgi:ferritin-like protein